MSEDQLAACQGKQGFANEALARQVVARRSTRTNYKKAKPVLNVYRCQFCHEFHIGATLRAAK